MKPEACIFHLLTRSAKLATRCWKQSVEEFGVTAVQGKVMNFLWVHGEVSARELGEMTALDGATLTGVLDRLEVMAMIVRRADSQDRRSVRVSLSEQGAAIGQAIHDAMEPSNEMFLAQFSEQEVHTLKALLERIR